MVQLEEGGVLSRPKSVQATLDLKVFRLSGTWEPDDIELRAAWALYVELTTRVGAIPLRDGLSREALSSLYSIFGRTREILVQYGPEVARPKRGGQLSFGFLAIGLLNNILRPFLSYWHPDLLDWEARRPEGTSVKNHERNWERDLELRQDLERLSGDVQQFIAILANACDVPLALRLPPGATGS